MNRLPPTPQTFKKLFALSGNRCAFPRCNQRLVDSEGNLVANICHIEAAEPKGERFNQLQTDEERRSFENLILFCPTHHVVTNNMDKYSVEVLKQMKADHEAQFAEELYTPSDSLLEQANKQYLYFFINHNSNNVNNIQIYQTGLDYQ